jgi:hypothetical protein
MSPSKPTSPDKQAAMRGRDTTSTKRGQALAERIKESGGAVVQLRADGELLGKIDDLVETEGQKSRAGLLKHLVEQRHARKVAKKT